MSALITTLRTRADRLRVDQAAELRQLVLDVPGLPEMAVGKIVAAIDRETRSTVPNWTFVMLSPTQHEAVVAWLLDHSSQPIRAVRLWAACFVDIRMDTGEIMMRRDELADRVGIQARDVSRIMSELVECKAIIRRREKITGMRGTGIVRYYMNPRVGTCLTGAERDRAQSEAPPLLALIKGGQPK